MRIKKGFTLAEILIVLMVIGVIAMLTIPSMMKGVTEAQLKAGYKKAYNTIVNVSAMERIAGGLPTQGLNANQMEDFYEALVQNLSVKFFVPFSSSSGADTSGTKSKGPDTKPCVTLKNNKATLGSGSSCVSTSGAAGLGSFPWVVTDDGLAYTLIGGGTASTDCGTKASINSKGSASDALKDSCLAVIADVNGLSKGPNTFEKQLQANGTTTLGAGEASSGQSLTQLVGDDYYIFLGQDGATSGNPAVTVTGRIVADLK